MPARGPFRRRLTWPLLLGGVAAACGGGTTSLSGGTALLTGGTSTTIGGTSNPTGGSGNPAGGSSNPSGGTGTGATVTGGTGTGGVDVGGAGCMGSLEEPHGGLCVAKMVALPEGYSIDSTEVTRAQYQAWLDTNPSTDGQISDCTWNTTFTPGVDGLGDSCRTDCDNHPRVCVDWCDAYAYCQAVGKRLCGKIGGGPNGYDDSTNASMSQWYNACTSHDPANYPYPYGNTYQATTCNDQDYWAHYDGETLPVGTLSGCQSPVSGYSGVHDLSGNVWEWEDSCSGPGESAYCRLRGADFFGNENNLACGFTWTGGVRYDVHNVIGFRCCSSP